MSAERPDSPPFVRVLEALDLDSQTLGQPVDATFIPGGPSGGGVDPSLDSLPRLALDDGTESTPELALEGVLGEGGRGEVRLAQQLSLRRQVAVKSLKGVRAPGLTQELLREARITGGLEHPNIVPVYALGRDAQNRVMLVMRKVNGAPWGRLLREQGPARTDADLERQLEIFRQVCHAVEFAHSQGIVHRDLKPDNVMIGGFGEVVVLDWGLAASLDGDAARELPRAADLRGLAGTPSYMAPELVRGEGGEVGRWTDVYLLGATLHEIVMGAPAGGMEQGGAHLQAAARPPHVLRLELEQGDRRTVAQRASLGKPRGLAVTARLDLQERLHAPSRQALARRERRQPVDLDAGEPGPARRHLAAQGRRHEPQPERA